MLSAHRRGRVQRTGYTKAYGQNS
uniref:Uncharacterized protein n=1 Tax=Arundo donax TaxID=35708 RepID=A0A0A8XS79_ARUDO